MKYSADEMISLFKGLGITEYEAKVYLSLLSSHPASAYTISQNSGVPHSRVYDVTRRLIRREMVVSTGTKPEMFSPLSPEKVIEKLQREYLSYSEKLETRLQEFEFQADFDPVWNLSERTVALEKAASILAEAKGTVYIGLWDAELPELRPSLLAAFQRGAQLFVLIYGEGELEFGTVYHHDTEHMAGYEELGRTLDCTVDSAWCISGTMGGPAACRVVWSQNRGLVQTIESYIKHDFYLAEITKDLGPEIESRYGKNLRNLRRKFGE